MCTHLIKRGSRYYIRRRVPLDLVSILGKSEVTKALHTSDRAEAVTRCRAEGVRLDTEWTALRQTREPVAVEPRTKQRYEMHSDDAAELAHQRRYIDEGEREAEAAAIELAVQQRVHVEREAQRRLANKPSHKPTAKPASKLLPDVVDAWQRERQPQASTVGIAQRVTRRFREMVGPVPVHAITRQHVIQLKDALLAANQTAVNTDKTLTMLSALLSYAHDQGWLSSNPAKGSKVGARSNAKAARLPFDLPALKLIFASDIYTQRARPAGGAGAAFIA
jgi:hypothetical protein